VATSPRRNTDIAFSSTPILAARLSTRRSQLVMFLIFVAFCALALRAFWIQVLGNPFYLKQGDVRLEHTLTLPAMRGQITDRNGLILATSLPVRTIWADSRDISDGIDPAKLADMSQLLGIPEPKLRADLSDDKSFVYIKRQVPVAVADQLKKLDIPGVYESGDFKRFYPEGDVTAQLVGFTNIGDHGQDGIELAEERNLQAQDGSQLVIRDRMGHVVQSVVELSAARNGKQIQLSIDSSIQYSVFSALEQAVVNSQAKAGAAIVVDAHTGEVLALANYPTYDPNDRAVLTGEQLRNRAMTDVFEPGSIMKPFTISLGLDLHRIDPDTTVETNGRFLLDGATITDDANFGTLTIGGVLQKSSNIGASKIAMLLKPEEMWNMYTALGFGHAPDLDFPGMGVGIVRPWRKWRRVEQATMSYGYGLSVSLVQLAHAYTVFANNGQLVPLTLYKRSGAPIQSVQVFTPETAEEVKGMLEKVVAPGGTAPQAQVPGYSAGGKTGTAYTATRHGYDRSEYRASFVGIVPIRNPRLIIAVSVDQPRGARHYGGDVSGPVFSKIASDSMRVLNIPPDEPDADHSPPSPRHRPIIAKSGLRNAATG
jgi:cell division protein FtsI (penicillin-binding protein 3)